MENSTIVSWLKTGKRLAAELEQCEKSLSVANCNPKMATSPIKGQVVPSKAGQLKKGKDKDCDIFFFQQFNEDARKESVEVTRQRENSKQLTMKRIMGLKVLFDAIREKLGDPHLLNNNAQNNFQDMLETFENKLTSFKLHMKEEFDSMESSEAQLYHEMMKLKLDMESWEQHSSTMANSPGTTHSEANAQQQIKKNMEKLKKDVDRKAIVGVLDRKVLSTSIVLSTKSCNVSFHRSPRSESMVAGTHETTTHSYGAGVKWWDPLWIHLQTNSTATKSGKGHRRAYARVNLAHSRKKRMINCSNSSSKCNYSLRGRAWKEKSLWHFLMPRRRHC